MAAVHPFLSSAVREPVENFFAQLGKRPGRFLVCRDSIYTASGLGYEVQISLGTRNVTVIVLQTTHLTELKALNAFKRAMLALVENLKTTGEIDTFTISLSSQLGTTPQEDLIDGRFGAEIPHIVTQNLHDSVGVEYRENTYNIRNMPPLKKW